jgi:hypothetical protein
MQGKVRLSATIDARLLSAAEAAVRRGDAASVSAWVNNAMELQLTHEKRLAALDEFLAAFEQEFGEITEAEIEDATKRTRATAVVVRSNPQRRVASSRSTKASRRSA